MVWAHRPGGPPGLRDARGVSISESKYPGWGQPRPNQPPARPAEPAEPANPAESGQPGAAGARPPSPYDSVWARPGDGATQQWPPSEERAPSGDQDATAPIGWDRQPGGWQGQPGTPPDGWRGEQGPPPGASQGQHQWGQPAWGSQPPPGRRPVRTPLIVAGGIALLLIAVVAVLTLRGAGETPRTASAGTAATLSPGAGGASADSNNSASNPGGSGGSGGSAGAGGGSESTGSLRLPDKVGGMARIPTDAPGLLQGQAGILDMVTRSGQLDGWGLGVYGPSADDPEFVFMVVRAREASSAGLIAGGMAGGVRSSLGGATSSKQTITRGGVRYECWNASAGSVCSFQSGAVVGVSFTRDGDLGRLGQLTDEARRGVHA